MSGLLLSKADRSRRKNWVIFRLRGVATTLKAIGKSRDQILNQEDAGSIGLKLSYLEEQIADLINDINGAKL